MSVLFTSVKHMAFASPDAQKAMMRLQHIFGEALAGDVRDVPAAHYRVAKFTLGGLEIQFCEPLEGDFRFSGFLAKRGPGLHHICFTVDDIETVVTQASSMGASLQACPSCGVTGSHVHPEGWIAFFAEATLPEMQIEVMQVYKAGEKEKFWGNREMV
jgi:methylmalonyl-CoA/ethylmalonyl-CoA epimerase